jgi:hypothetical protein
MSILRDIERAARLAGIARRIEKDRRNTPPDLEEIAPGIYGPRRPGRRNELKDLADTARTIRRVFADAIERFEEDGND